MVQPSCGFFSRSAFLHHTLGWILVAAALVPALQALHQAVLTADAALAPPTAPDRHRDAGGPNKGKGNGNGNPDIPGALLVSRERDEAITGGDNGGQDAKAQKALQRERVKEAATEVPATVVGWVIRTSWAGAVVLGRRTRLPPRGQNHRV